MDSYRFEDLKKRCESLHRKRIVKRFVFTLFFAFVIIAILFFYMISDKPVKSAPAQEKLVKKSKTVYKNTTNKESLTKEITKRKKLDLQPKIVLPKVEKKLPKKVKKVKTIKEKIVKTDTKEAKPKININFKSVDSETVLMKNYENNSNYANALKLALFFYKKQEYKKVVYWSKMASKFDSTKDTPWILYAKAKYNLGEKKEAINSLKTYLGYFNSLKASKLLEDYMKGIKK